jgi:hypothetical protein
MGILARPQKLTRHLRSARAKRSIMARNVTVALECLGLRLLAIVETAQLAAQNAHFGRGFETQRHSIAGDTTYNNRYAVADHNLLAYLAA